MVPGNVSFHIRLVTWRREISRLRFAALEMTLGTRRSDARRQTGIVPGHYSSFTAGHMVQGDFGVPLEMTGLRGYQTLASRGGSILQKCGMPHFCKMEMDVG